MDSRILLYGDDSTLISLMEINLMYSLNGFSKQEMEKMNKEEKIKNGPILNILKYINSLEKRSGTIKQNFFCTSKKKFIIDSVKNMDDIKKRFLRFDYEIVLYVISVFDVIDVDKMIDSLLIINMMNISRTIICVNLMELKKNFYQRITKQKDLQKEFHELKMRFINKLTINNCQNKVIFLPYFCDSNDNIVKKSDAFPWWNGQCFSLQNREIYINTLLDFLEVEIRSINVENEIFISRFNASIINKNNTKAEICIETCQGILKINDDVCFVSQNIENCCIGHVDHIYCDFKNIKESTSKYGKFCKVCLKNIDKNQVIKKLTIGDYMIKKSDMIKFTKSKHFVLKIPKYVTNMFVSQIGKKIHFQKLGSEFQATLILIQQNIEMEREKDESFEFSYLTFQTDVSKLLISEKQCDKLSGIIMLLKNDTIFAKIMDHYD